MLITHARLFLLAFTSALLIMVLAQGDKSSKSKGQATGNLGQSSMNAGPLRKCYNATFTYSWSKMPQNNGPRFCRKGCEQVCEEDFSHIRQQAREEAGSRFFNPKYNMCLNSPEWSSVTSITENIPSGWLSPLCQCQFRFTFREISNDRHDDLRGHKRPGRSSKKGQEGQPPKNSWEHSRRTSPAKCDFKSFATWFDGKVGDLLKETTSAGRKPIEPVPTRELLMSDFLCSPIVHTFSRTEKSSTKGALVESPKRKARPEEIRSLVKATRVGVNTERNKRNAARRAIGDTMEETCAIRAPGGTSQNSGQSQVDKVQPSPEQPSIEQALVSADRLRQVFRDLFGPDDPIPGLFAESPNQDSEGHDDEEL